MPVVLQGYDARGVSPSANKVERARTLASAAQRGGVRLVRGAWNGAWLDAAEGYPFGPHDDQVDSAGLGIAVLTGKRAPKVVAPGGVQKQGWRR